MVAGNGAGKPAQTNGELTALLLAADRTFRTEWLAGLGATADLGDVWVVPVPAPVGLDHDLAVRMGTGARSLGTGHGLAGRPERDRWDEPVRAVRLDVEDDLLGLGRVGGDVLVTTTDLHAAMLVTTAGYALVAGPTAFVRAVTGHGPDEARARFGRYARRASAAHPELVQVAAAHPPVLHSVGTAAGVPPGTALAEQWGLMERLIEGAIGPDDFAEQWLAARRREQAKGERAHGSLRRALDEVFYALEDCTPDPALRDPDDLSDEDLVARVRAALRAAGAG